jgi:hypothetical protein
VNISSKVVLLSSCILGTIALSAGRAEAVTFGVYSPVGTATNISLSGLNLSANAPVIFDYQLPLLASLGNLSANFSLTATETGAIAFGPISLASFDGSFALTYTGSNVTAGSITVHTGDNLLSGTFLGSVFSGLGSSASLVDSLSGGGLVSFNSAFLNFGLGD